MIPKLIKKTILSLAGLLLSATAFSQKINYQKTFDGAFEKAAAEKKLLLVVLTTPIPPVNPPGVNKFVYRSALDDAKVVDFYNKNFVAYTVLFTDPSATALRQKYQLSRFPAYLFIDSHNNLVYKEAGNSIEIQKYLNMGEAALTAQSSGKTVSNYEAQYLLGNKTAESIKEYINLRMNMGIYDNAKLIDEYVDQITIKSLQDYNEVLFILKAGPYAYGKAYNLCLTNRKIFDSIYKSEPVALRTAINDRIVGNTINEAVKRKDANMAQQGANYVAGTWRNNYRQAAMASQSRMLGYYISVKDTGSYYRQATYFYDGYYMNISADSAKRKEQINFENARKAALAHLPDSVTTLTGPDSTKRYVRKTIVVQSASMGGPANGTAMALNNAAWQYYSLGTTNQNYLSKAILWSKRSIALDPRYNYYDTLAHLLYAMEFYGEAQSTEATALNLAETNGAGKVEIEKLKGELAKIKERKLTRQ